MKILVYGAGAVGGFLGAKLGQHGHQITLVTRDESVKIINTDGLKLTQDQKTSLTRPRAVSSIPQAFESIPGEGPYDLIIMAMKSYDLDAAVDPLIAFCPTPPPIITMQNGIDVEQPLIAHYGPDRIIPASLTVPVSKEFTNHILVERSDRGLALAPALQGQNIRPWVQLFQQMGIMTIGLPDYQAMKWSKVFLNIAGNATAAILNRSPKAIYKVGVLFDLEIRMLRETLAVMRRLKLPVVNLPGAAASRLALGIRLAPRFLLKPVLTSLVGHGRGEKLPSFHIDLIADKRKSEVLYHNGAIAKAGQACGVPTPVNLTLTLVLQQLTQHEVDWHDYDGNARRLLAEVRQQAAAGGGR